MYNHNVRMCTLSWISFKKLTTSPLSASLAFSSLTQAKRTMASQNVFCHRPSSCHTAIGLRLLGASLEVPVQGLKLRSGHDALRQQVPKLSHEIPERGTDAEQTRVARVAAERV